jgi:hypothetical protein
MIDPAHQLLAIRPLLTGIAFLSHAASKVLMP